MDSTPSKIVLYVEDNPVNRHLMKAIFATRAGETLLSASTGDAALRLAEEHPPDLVLLDLHLPDMTGVEFLRRLRALAGMATTPVVIVSGDSLDESQISLRDVDIAAFVSKPIDIDLFERWVDRLLLR